MLTYLKTKLPQVRKALTALVSGVIAWAYIVIGSAPLAITAHEWVGLAVVVAGALGVYTVTNAA